jgi:hypothetical protein
MADMGAKPPSRLRPGRAESSLLALKRGSMKADFGDELLLRVCDRQSGPDARRIILGL